MSRWYKKSFGNNLTSVITVWLRNAKNHPETASAHDDISFQMAGPDHANNLAGAINSAVMIIKREQGGMLTPSQEDLVMNLQARNQDQADPMAIKPLDPMNNQMQPDNMNGLAEPNNQIANDIN